MDGTALRDILTEALRRLIVTEWDLAVVAANERTVTSHLSRLIYDVGLPWWLRADHDYNRHLMNEKRAWLATAHVQAEHGIVPDVVIHRRGVDDENLLVLEAKRTRRCDTHDETKIRALLEEPFHYRFGVLLGLGIRSDQDDSWWDPAWSWLTNSQDELQYVEVFDQGECADLNAEGRKRWEERLSV